MYRFDPGATSISLEFKLRDSTTGLAQTGLTAASGGAIASYTRRRGSTTPITLTALASETDSWTSGGFIQNNSTTAAGLYRLDVPDAAFASGVPYVIVSLAFTGVIEESVLVRLETSTSNVGAGSIAFTITVTDSVSTLPVSGAAVWVTTDQAGTNVVAGASYTNASGQVVFYLDSGQYWYFVQRESYAVSNPTPITVS